MSGGGIGYAVTYKNVAFSEGFDDYSTARVRLEATAGEAVATVHTAAAEVGQGLITVEQQICRTELGVDLVVLHPKDTRVGSAGSTSASRQTYMTGGAVKAACEAVRRRVLERAAAQVGRPVGSLRLDAGKVVADTGEVVASLADLLGAEAVDETVEWHHRPTEAVDPETGQGNAHVQYAFSAHRAVVDVDTELGLVKVVALDTAQDVGRAINPQAVVGQIQGGSTQGMGLALMEEIVVPDGVIRNPSFTDYLIPTILDTPRCRSPCSSTPTRTRRTASGRRRTRRPSRPGRPWLPPSAGLRSSPASVPIRPSHHRHLTDRPGLIVAPARQLPDLRRRAAGECAGRPGRPPCREPLK